MSFLGDQGRYASFFKATRRVRRTTQRVVRLTEDEKLEEAHDMMPALLAEMSSTETLWHSYKSSIHPALLADKLEEFHREEMEILTTRLRLDRAINVLSQREFLSREGSEGESDTNTTNFAILPLYDGNTFTLTSWISLFEIRVVPKHNNDIDIVLELLQYLDGPALEALQEVVRHPFSYTYRQAKEMLVQRFQDPAAIMQELTQEVLELRNIRNEGDINEVTELLLTIQSLLERHGYEDHYNHQELCMNIIDKFNSPSISMKWKEMEILNQTKYNESQTLEDLICFICYGIAREKPDGPWTVDPILCKRTRAVEEGTCGAPGCSHHGNPNKVLKETRQEAVYNELTYHHEESSPAFNTPSQEEQISRSVPHSMYPTHEIVNRSKILLPLVKVAIEGHEAVAMLDQGSSVSLITNRLVRELGIEGVATNVTIHTIVGSQNTATMTINCNIKSLHNDQTFNISNCLSVPELPMSIPDVSREELSIIDHIDKVPWLPTGQPIVDLLIGQDNAHLLLTLEHYGGRPGKPIITKTPLGMVIQGPLSSKVEIKPIPPFLCITSPSGEVENDINISDIDDMSDFVHDNHFHEPIVLQQLVSGLAQEEQAQPISTTHQDWHDWHVEMQYVFSGDELRVDEKAWQAILENNATSYDSELDTISSLSEPVEPLEVIHPINSHDERLSKPSNEMLLAPQVDQTRQISYCNTIRRQNCSQDLSHQDTPWICDNKPYGICLFTQVTIFISPECLMRLIGLYLRGDLTERCIEGTPSGTGPARLMDAQERQRQQESNLATNTARQLPPVMDIVYNQPDGNPCQPTTALNKQQQCESCIAISSEGSRQEVSKPLDHYTHTLDTPLLSQARGLRNVDAKSETTPRRNVPELSEYLTPGPYLTPINTDYDMLWQYESRDECREVTIANSAETPNYVLGASNSRQSLCSDQEPINIEPAEDHTCTGHSLYERDRISTRYYEESSTNQLTNHGNASTMSNLAPHNPEEADTFLQAQRMGSSAMFQELHSNHEFPEYQHSTLTKDEGREHPLSIILKKYHYSSDKATRILAWWRRICNSKELLKALISTAAPLEKRCNVSKPNLRMLKALCEDDCYSNRESRRSTTHILQPLTKCEIKEAERRYLKHEQGLYFSRELDQLATYGQVSEYSVMYPLYPGMLNGVLVANNQGMLVICDDPKPVILPAESKLAEALMSQHHFDRHVEDNWDPAEFHAKYHILNVDSVLCGVIRNCLFCKIQRTVEEATDDEYVKILGTLRHHAFSHTTMSITGPFPVCNEGVEAARYAVIFVCTTIRALHIEYISSLTTNSVVLAYNRFTARRGTPVMCVFDLVNSSSHYIKTSLQGLKNINIDQIASAVQAEGTEWLLRGTACINQVNIPRTWESQLRIICDCLQEAFDVSGCFSDENLITMLSRTEHLINSRPISRMGENSRHKAFTPNDVLLPRRNSMHAATITRSELLCHQVELVKCFVNEFWKKWSPEYLLNLQRESALRSCNTELTIGDLVIMLEPRPNNDQKWKTALVNNITDISRVSTNLRKLKPGTLKMIGLHFPTSTGRKLERHVIKLGSKYLPGFE